VGQEVIPLILMIKGVIIKSAAYPLQWADGACAF
jgi:hypothetical protein